MDISDAEVPVWEPWEMSSSPSLPLLPGPIWSGVVAPDNVPPMDQKELFKHLTVCEQTSAMKVTCKYNIVMLESI